MVFENGTGNDWIDRDTQTEFDPIYKRAHTFDGYRHLGSDWQRINEFMLEARSAWLSHRMQGWDLEDLRAALFMEARSIHHEGYPPTERLFVYLRDLDRMIAEQVRIPLDCSEEYRQRDLFSDGIWPAGDQQRFGAVIFNDLNQVLLREPRCHYDGYTWTFAKTKANPDEHPLDAAFRAVAEEYGIPDYGIEVIGHVTGVYSGSTTGSSNYYYLVRSVLMTPEPRGDTVSVRWFPPEQAANMIEQSQNKAGRARDLATLRAAVAQYTALTAPLNDRGEGIEVSDQPPR